ncbi:hypothetical protein [Mucilaginibacter celer]|uniref:Uncharacterized protein n=1 Tax=Mucilaginibacter celer TaxID=2305508 RepID=A0A494VL46_9SPHI|nr:hypothetical protein [Mucilaginibacter celer]AYL95224.1 hypothetical protein HYN43_007915 [Mucilaginibacter celer]
METTNRSKKLALCYLYLVPPVVAAIGFGIRPVSCTVYLPLWLLNSGLMLRAAFLLVRRRPNGYIASALLLLVPWLLFAIFAGMGPPPVNIAGWLTTAATQQTRYTILIVGGICAYLGFGLLKEKFENPGERMYAVLGFALLTIALPLFLLNMAFWGYYLPTTFKGFRLSPTEPRPGWYVAFKELFYIIAVTEVALIYLATSFFAVAMKKAKLLSSVSCNWYRGFGIAGIILTIIPPSWPEPLSMAGYLATIPAIPFTMPYLLGVRLLKGYHN